MITNKELAAHVHKLLADHEVYGEVMTWFRSQPRAEVINGWDGPIEPIESPAQRKLQVTAVSYNGANHLGSIFPGNYKNWTIGIGLSRLNMSLKAEEFPVHLCDEDKERGEIYWSIPILKAYWAAIEKRLSPDELELLRQLRDPNS